MMTPEMKTRSQGVEATLDEHHQVPGNDTPDTPQIAETSQQGEQPEKVVHGVNPAHVPATPPELSIQAANPPETSGTLPGGLESANDFMARRTQALTILYDTLDALPDQGVAIKADATDFLTEFYHDRKKKSLSSTWCIDPLEARPHYCFHLENTREKFKAFADVYFFGQGRWRYRVVVHKTYQLIYQAILEHKGVQSDDNPAQADIFTYDYQGEGERWRYPFKEGECNHIFSFEDDVEAHLCLEEDFTQRPEKMYAINSGLRAWDDRVSPAWSLGYYDGPLSGFCKLNHSLHYYCLSEEQDFSGARLYAIHPLTWCDKARAHGLRFLWTRSMGKKPWHPLSIAYKALRPLLNLPKGAFERLPSIGGCVMK